MTKKLATATANRRKMAEAGYRPKEVLLKDAHSDLIDSIKSEQGHKAQWQTFEYVLDDYQKLKRLVETMMQSQHGDQQVSR